MVEFAGLIHASRTSELIDAVGGETPVDPAYIREFVRAHEDAGFDRVLVGHSSSGADAFSVAAHAAIHTERLGFVVALRAGFVAPTLAARQLATLDQLSRGRAAVQVVTGGTDAELRRDGDFADKPTRYRRTSEYIDVLKKTWTSETPFDHEGDFYRVEGGFSAVKPVQQPHLPLFLRGSSEWGMEIAARHADTWAMFGEPVAQVQARASAIRELAARYGRTIGVSVSLRVILGPTEEKAWERAYWILERMRVQRPNYIAPRAASVSTQRLLDAAAKGDILDRRLFTAIAKFNGAAGNSTALVGTPDHVAESLLAYVDAGATTLLIRGYEPLRDAIDYGRDLLPVVRAELKSRERELVAV